MKVIHASYKKSIDDIKAKIIVSLPDEYFEVLAAIEWNLGMILKLIKKAIVKYCKYRIKASQDSK